MTRPRVGKSSDGQVGPALRGFDRGDRLRPDDAVYRSVVEPERAQRNLNARMLRVHVRARRRCEDARRHPHGEKHSKPHGRTCFGLAT